MINETNTAKFTMIDEDFVCEVCHTKVKALGYTARDHCPKCLCSKHVDINPGDRACTCHGILKPVAIEKGKKTIIKLYMFAVLVVQSKRIRQRMMII